MRCDLLHLNMVFSVQKEKLKNLSNVGMPNPDTLSMGLKVMHRGETVVKPKTIYKDFNHRLVASVKH